MAGMTDLARSDASQSLREQLRNFLNTEVRPWEVSLARAGWEERGTIVGHLRDRARSHGLWGYAYPGSSVGGSLSLREYASYAELEGEYLEGPAVLGSAALADVMIFNEYASPTLRERVLAPLLAGELITCHGVSEPGRSDPGLSQLVTRAVRDGDCWVITGRKWFTMARGADVMTVLCRTGSYTDPTVKAFSLLVVPIDAHGVEITRDLPVLGAAGGHVEVRLHEVRVPADYLLGAEGAGYAVMSRHRTLERLLRSLTWLGQAQRAFDLMCQRLRTRRTATGPLAEKQLMQRHVFDSYQEIIAVRTLLRDLAARLDTGDPDIELDLSAAKVLTSHMFCGVTDRAVQVFGAEGLTDDTPLSLLFRMARASRIHDGADEIHVQAVARRVLSRPDPGPVWPIPAQPGARASYAASTQSAHGA